MSEALVTQFQAAVGEVTKGIGETSAAVAKLSAQSEATAAATNKLGAELDTIRRQIGSAHTSNSIRKRGFVTDDCAAHLAALFVLGNDAHRRLDQMDPRFRDPVLAQARSILGIQTRDALTAANIPLPIQYGSQLRELILDFGVARKYLTTYPIPMGTAKPPRMGTRPAFTLIALSGAVGEKSPTITYASLESHKFGGIVRVPRELDEQSMVPMGQYLAQYGAREFARLEDTVAFLADGTATYDNISGIAKTAATNNKLVTLGATKTGPADATLANFRALRTKVDAAALANARYFLHHTWEQRLRDFKLIATGVADTMVYQQQGPNGEATLDGYPITWVGVMAPYDTAANADTTLALFGDASYYWFGEHGAPRVDFSSDVYFGTDELATRFLEEFDIDYNAVGSMAALKTAAA